MSEIRCISKDTSLFRSCICTYSLMGIGGFDTSCRTPPPVRGLARLRRECADAPCHGARLVTIIAGDRSVWNDSRPTGYKGEGRPAPSSGTVRGKMRGTPALHGEFRERDKGAPCRAIRYGASGGRLVAESGRGDRCAAMARRGAELLRSAPLGRRAGPRPSDCRRQAASSSTARLDIRRTRSGGRPRTTRTCPSRVSGRRSTLDTI